LVVVLLVAAGFGWADGKIWSVSGELPAMPKQRAFLHWKSGVETLIVESDYVASSPDNTWLIPVPSKPEAIDALAPGALESLQAILPIPVSTAEPSLAPALLVLAASLYAATVRRRCERFGRWLAFTILPMALVTVFAWIFYPVFAKSGKAGSAGSASQATRIGSYNVAVVSGFEGVASVPNLPPALHATFEQYRKEGWSIVVANLRTEQKGLATPHPLRVRFRAATPIYPMRLTGVDAEPLHLDLFVLGKSAAAHRSLHRFAAREVTRGLHRWSPIGHPDLAPLMEFGDVLTRLSGVLSRREMAEDLNIRWTPGDTSTVGAVDPRDLPKHWVIWGAFVTSACLLLLSAFAFGLKALASLPRVLIVSVAIGTGFATLLASTTPTYERGMARAGIGAELQFKHILSRAVDASSYGETATAREAEFRRLLAKEGTPPERAVPGGFTLDRSDDKLVVTAYDSGANPKSELLFGSP